MCIKATIGRSTLNEITFSSHYTNERRLCSATQLFFVDWYDRGRYGTPRIAKANLIV